jgi:hypothetical protein
VNKINIRSSLLAEQSSIPQHSSTVLWYGPLPNIGTTYWLHTREFHPGADNSSRYTNLPGPRRPRYSRVPCILVLARL